VFTEEVDDARDFANLHRVIRVCLMQCGCTHFGHFDLFGGISWERLEVRRLTRQAFSFDFTPKHEITLFDFLGATDLRL
jgi:hypothetical protein